MVVAIIGIGVLYGLLILFGQFVAQGVVEEKSSRVVELLLATMKPWQLLAGKIVGLGLLGLAQIVVIAVVGVAGALAFDLVDIPGELIGTAVSVVLWFVLGYAFYAAIFAVAASLVSRQEDLRPSSCRRRWSSSSPSSSASRPPRTRTAPSPSSRRTCRGSRRW